MAKANISRRAFGAVVGAGAATAAAVPARGQPGGVTDAAQPAPAQRTSDPSQLLAPLSAGDKLGAWVVLSVGELDGGAVSIMMRDASGEDFQLDVCARDERTDAPGGPGQTQRFAVYLANSGKGNLPTRESHGLAAMAVADVIRGNEARLDASGFLPLREREHRGLARRHLC